MTTHVELSAMAALFDMDGVLVDSTAVADSVWLRWAERRGVEIVIERYTGWRTTDILRTLAPHLDTEAEAAAIEQAEIDAADGITPLPGAVELISRLPATRWAVVTSASRALARARLRAAGFPAPRVLVAADDVAAGKPNPECYLAGARALDVDAQDCVVVEDAPAGVAAGKAAGMRVVGVMTSHGAEALAAADHVLPGLVTLRLHLDGHVGRSDLPGQPAP